MAFQCLSGVVDGAQVGDMLRCFHHGGVAVMGGVGNLEIHDAPSLWSCEKIEKVKPSNCPQSLSFFI
jgi:hypothetical protein